MKYYQKIVSYLHYFMSLRVFYTLYFNFKYLPINQAKKLPIRFYKFAYASVGLGGKIILSNEMINRGNRVIIGKPTLDFEYQCERTHLNIFGGTLSLNGDFEMRRGALMDIRGYLECQDNVLIGARCRVRIHKKASFGSWCRITHETQIFDTNFHPMESIENRRHNPISYPIIIGSYCYIANRSTIMPGVVLPDYTTVASNSLVNKNIQQLKPYSVIGGVPARVIKEGYTRVWDAKREIEYQKEEFPWFKKWYEGIHKNQN